MDVETLLKTLHEAGMDEAAISDLLNQALASLKPAGEEQPDESAEIEEASKLLGVSL